jgi:hypothetical protein
MSYNPDGIFGRAYKRAQQRKWREADGGLRNRLRRRIQYQRSIPKPDYEYIASLVKAYNDANNR